MSSKKESVRSTISKEAAKKELEGLSRFSRFVAKPRKKGTVKPSGLLLTQYQFLSRVFHAQHPGHPLEVGLLDHGLVTRLTTNTKFPNMTLAKLKEVANVLKIPVAGLIGSEDVSYINGELTPQITSISDTNRRSFPKNRLGNLDLYLKIGPNYSLFKFSYLINRLITNDHVATPQVSLCLLEDVPLYNLHMEHPQNSPKDLALSQFMIDANKVTCRIFQTSEDVIDLFSNTTNYQIIKKAAEPFFDSHLLQKDESFRIQWFTELKNNAYNTVTFDSTSSISSITSGQIENESQFVDEINDIWSNWEKRFRIDSQDHLS